MEPQQLFVFDPPFSIVYITNVKTEMCLLIPVYEIEKRQYLEGALDSLVAYAIEKKRESKNFSLNVAFFNLDFTPTDSREIWSKANIWVKIKIKGGLGLAFRNRYMASQCGVERVDWKRKTYRAAKIRRSAGTSNTEEGVGSSTLLLNNSDRSHPVEESKNDISRRARDRLHLIAYTPEYIFQQLLTMTPSDFRTVLESERIQSLSSLMFKALDRSDAGGLDQKDFLRFWTSVLRCSETEGIAEFALVAGEGGRITPEQFAPLFRNVLETRIG